MKRRLGLHGNVVASSPHTYQRTHRPKDGAHTGRPTAMDIVGLDLHKRESQLASTAPDGTITDRRIVTNRDRLTAVFGDRPRAHILLEASTESERVARPLEALGHEVIVT